VPQEPDFTSNGSLAKARHMASTGPASVIPYPCDGNTNGCFRIQQYPFLHLGNWNRVVQNQHSNKRSRTTRRPSLVQLVGKRRSTGTRGGTRPPRIWEEFFFLTMNLGGVKHTQAPKE
jgi:hypothetical protein